MGTVAFAAMAAPGSGPLPTALHSAGAYGGTANRESQGRKARREMRSVERQEKARGQNKSNVPPQGKRKTAKFQFPATWRIVREGLTATRAVMQGRQVAARSELLDGRRIT